MTRGIIVDPAADSDVDEQFYYLAERNLDAALRYLEATTDTFEQIAEMPGIGSIRRVKNPELSGLRMWSIKGFENYLVFYLTTEESIRVLRVLHGARDIERILERGR